MLTLHYPAVSQDSNAPYIPYIQVSIVNLFAVYGLYFFIFIFLLYQSSLYPYLITVKLFIICQRNKQIIFRRLLFVWKPSQSKIMLTLPNSIDSRTRWSPSLHSTQTVHGQHTAIHTNRKSILSGDRVSETNPTQCQDGMLLQFMILLVSRQ